MLKVNLIIDGNYLLYKDVFILKKYRSIDDLGVLMEKDYHKITKSFPFTNVYFVSDRGKSWRKSLITETYKANRKKDETLDWNMIFEEYDTFKTNISQKINCQLSEIDGLEGDDLISYIVRNSNLEGYSNVIVASDADLQQLLHFNLEQEYINFMWNYKFNDERIYIPEHFELFLKHLDQANEDIFNLSDNAEFIKYVEDLVQKTKVKEVNAEKALFCKLITGDSSDNIPGIIKLKGGEINEAGQGIGNKGAEKCYDMYKESYPDIIDFNSIEFVDNCVEICAFYKKVKDLEIKEVMQKNLELNLRLILLDEEFLPPLLGKELKESLQFNSTSSLSDDDFWD
jgi:5'-3' exonuclease